MGEENEIYRWYADTIVYRIFGPLIASFGFLGGTLSLLVFRRKSLKKKSCSIYFFYLALADLLCMICWLIHFVLPTYNIHLLTFSNLSCKIFVFAMYFAFDLANYLLTVCSMDRAASILFPIESRRFCHRRMANLITVALVCILTLLNSHFFYGFVVLSMRSTTNEQISICHHRMDSERYRRLFSIYDSYVDVIKTNVIPFIVMTICNVIIIVRVCRSNPQLHLSNSSASTPRYRKAKSKKKFEKDRQLTLMLLGSAIAFLFLTLPTEINDIIRSYSQENLVNEKSYLFSAILLSLAHLNYAVHFYIYTLTGEVFRQQLVKLWPINRIWPWVVTFSRCKNSSTMDLTSNRTNLSRNTARQQYEISLMTTRINDENDSCIT